MTKKWIFSLSALLCFIGISTPAHSANVFFEDFSDDPNWVGMDNFKWTVLTNIYD